LIGGLHVPAVTSAFSGDKHAIARIRVPPIGDELKARNPLRIGGTGLNAQTGVAGDSAIVGNIDAPAADQIETDIVISDLSKTSPNAETGKYPRSVDQQVDQE